MSFLATVICICITIICGCSDPRSRQILASVASIGGLDDAASARITRIFDEHDIPCIIYGSVVYGVSVPEEYEGQAIELLLSDARADPYDVTIFNGSKGETFTYADPLVVFARLEARHLEAKLIALGIPHLVAMFQQQDIKTLLRSYPFIEAISVQFRNDGTKQGLYYVEFKLSVTPEEEVGGCTWNYLVKESGEFTRMGGSEWLQGTDTEIEENRQKYNF